MTLISKNVYIDELADIVYKYNNTHHSKTKVKSVGVKSKPFIDFGTKNNEEDPKFKVGDHVKISKI